MMMITGVETFKKVACRLLLARVFRDVPLVLQVGSESLAFRTVEPEKKAVTAHVNSWQTLFWILAKPRLRVGEAYQAGTLSVVDGDLSTFVDYLFLSEHRFLPSPIRWLLNALERRRFEEKQRYGVTTSEENIHLHYDIGNEFYRLFLDENMVYSCAFFEDSSSSLENAQMNKIEKALSRCGAKDADQFLEIGCGWGALSKRACESGARAVTSLTLSREQYSYCREDLKGTQANVLLQDYRTHAAENEGAYQSIASVGMFEHVGLQQFSTYFSSLDKLLQKDGRALVHTIVRPKPGVTNEWIDKYVFPGGYIASKNEFLSAANSGKNLRIEVVHSHEGHHYATTLKTWRSNLASKKEEAIALSDDYLYRTFEFYLAASEAAFRTLGMKVIQVELRKVVPNQSQEGCTVNEIEVTGHGMIANAT